LDYDLKKYFIKWVEEYLFFPTPFQSLIGLFFLPFTLLYCVFSTYNRLSKKPIEFGLPVISIGNLLVGGTGKTPVTIFLAKRYKNSAIILRGYGRKSKGLLVVSDGNKVLEDVESAGDEAILYTKSLSNTIIIVSEDRKQAILKARELGAKVILLDDGYRHHDIKKFDILLRPKKEPTNIFCLPSGGYRDTKMMYSFADSVLKEENDFKRVVTFKYNGDEVISLPQNTVLLTAISKADRLLEYLPQDIPSMVFEDHHNFTKEDIQKFLETYPESSIVTTGKDLVKLEKFHLKNLYLMDLDVMIEDKSLEKIDKYMDNYYTTKD
jgi:tetraacyldisaccharide 4'-kinase